MKNTEAYMVSHLARMVAEANTAHINPNDESEAVEHFTQFAIAVLACFMEYYFKGFNAVKWKEEIDRQTKMYRKEKE